MVLNQPAAGVNLEAAFAKWVHSGGTFYGAFKAGYDLGLITGAERLREKYEIPRERIRASISISTHQFTPGWRGHKERCGYNGCSWYAENHVADRTTPLDSSKDDG